MNDDTAAEDQFIDFKCPTCGVEVSFPATSAGSIQECLDCTEPLIVPAGGNEGMRIPLPITTARLTLRKFCGTDWKDLMNLFANEEFFAAAPFKLDSEERIARWLEEDAVVKLTSPGVPFILAVQAQEGAKVIGCLSLSFSDAERLQAILYIVIHPEFQRKGLGSEAIIGALSFCFQGISLHRVQGFCDGTNVAACGLFEKAGMRREGEFVRDHKVDDQWVNSVAYAILSEEFKASPGQ